MDIAIETIWMHALSEDMSVPDECEHCCQANVLVMVLYNFLKNCNQKEA